MPYNLRSISNPTEHTTPTDVIDHRRAPEVPVLDVSAGVHQAPGVSFDTSNLKLKNIFTRYLIGHNFREAAIADVLQDDDDTANMWVAQASVTSALGHDADCRGQPRWLRRLGRQRGFEPLLIEGPRGFCCFGFETPKGFVFLRSYKEGVKGTAHTTSKHTKMLGDLTSPD